MRRTRAFIACAMDQVVNQAAKLRYMLQADLCAPSTSVSMTINGPALAILAVFFNTAIDQRLDTFRASHGHEPYESETQEMRAWVLGNVRGTVQADILKEDQGQNTCIFSTDFALRCMGDIQQYFIDNQVRNFYSVSISGYHIAEAGANPISQLAFTLANGFTYVEAYLARGMEIDDFAPQPVVLLLQRPGRRVLRHRQGRPADLGHSDEGALRRGRAAAEAQVPRADLRPVPARPGNGLQRHPHHAASPVRHLRQRQQPAHQRLRRGRHYPERALGPPGARHPDGFR
jgi:hypothetical protein